MVFESVTFWCEFPEKVNWKEFQKIIDFPCNVYIAARTRKEFEKEKNKIKSKYVTVGAWPILSFEEGYWFSGLSTKESIDKLKEFKGLKIKIDLEPPIKFRSYSDIKALFYSINYFLFKRYPQNKYLLKTIYKLGENTDIIASGYPFPYWLSKKYGGNVQPNKRIRKNYFIYTTYFPQPLKEILYPYYKHFIKKKLKEENVMFALGCIGPGIFGNERVYKDVDEFRKDLLMFLALGVKHLVIFEIAGIMHREHPEEWIRVIREHYKK